MRLMIAGVAFIGFAGSTPSQQPYAGLQNRAITTLSEQQIADLNAGRCMGLALAVELNGYPRSSSSGRHFSINTIRR